MRRAWGVAYTPAAGSGGNEPDRERKEAAGQLEGSRPLSHRARHHSPGLADVAFGRYSFGTAIFAVHFHE